jgi:hypothetical protein
MIKPLLAVGILAVTIAIANTGSAEAQTPDPDYFTAYEGLSLERTRDGILRVALTRDGAL